MSPKTAKLLQRVTHVLLLALTPVVAIVAVYNLVQRVYLEETLQLLAFLAATWVLSMLTERFTLR